MYFFLNCLKTAARYAKKKKKIDFFLIVHAICYIRIVTLFICRIQAYIFTKTISASMIPNYQEQLNTGEGKHRYTHTHIYIYIYI